MATGGSAAASLTSQSKNEALTCALCLDIYRQPKLLPCFHTYCLKCVEDLVDQARSKDDTTGDRDEAEPLKKHEKVVAAEEVAPEEAEDIERGDSIEEKINDQIPASVDDLENEKIVDSTIDSFPGGDDLAETRAEFGFKGEDNLTASTTTGYTSPSGKDELASDVFSADGVSQVDPQASEAATISETVAENIQKPTKRFFLCPSCRKQIEVPEGGASAFQNNVYLREDELERAREETQGLTHSCKTYDLFCVRCDTLICINCKLSGHLHHESQTLAEAAANAKTTISQNKARLKSAREGLEKNAKERATDRDQFADKKDLLEKEIHQRRSKIVAAADKYCDEALTALKKTFTTSATKDSKALDDVNKNISEIRGLEERMLNAETWDDQCELVLVAKELRCGSGSRQVVDKLASLPKLSEISRPVLRSSAERDDVGKMFTTMEKFIGTAEYVTVKTSEQEVSAKLILCKDVAPNAECFCVCSYHKGRRVRVTFIPSFENQAPLNISDTGDGTLMSTFDNHEEWKDKKVTIVSRRDKILNFIYDANDKDSVKYLYAKSYSPNIFRLSKPQFSFSVETMKVISDNPLKTKTETVFDITSYGNIQAFDIGDQEQLAAVIFKDSQTKVRQVKLFRRPQYQRQKAEKAVATYTPQMTTSVLADVCFFTLQGQEVLLIADETNDAIHVVEVKDDKMTFSRFLSPGCPLLLQPTALNTDHQGRLWVGCRGGRLVTFRQAICDDDDEEEVEEEEEEERS